jgi:uncharacterized protein
MTKFAGRGLFATKTPLGGQLLHTAPVILVPKAEYDNHAKHTTFEHYLFCVGNDKFLALGYGSLFNHARKPNVDYRIDAQAEVIRYYAPFGHNIQAGDELCIFYGPDKDLWFEMPPDEDEKAKN